jgi:YggT family protein
MLILGLQFIRNMLLSAVLSASAGSRGLYHLLVSWTIGILQIALIIRVLASWLRISEYKAWIHWTVPLTEWLLRPLRSVIPPFGMMDVSPIVAYFLLMLLGNVLHSIGAG